MKITTATSTLLFVLAALPAATPAQTPAGGRAEASAQATPNLRARLNAAIEELQKKAVARGATREDYQRVVEQMTAAAR